MNHPTYLNVEVLESRIAPAVIFLGTNNEVIHGKNGAYEVQELAAKTSAGSSDAVFLKAGDSLVIDLDNDQQLDLNETKLLAVTTGSAMAFLTRTGVGWSVGDLSGLSLSNGFVGTVNGTVEGSVVTALDANGTFTAEAGRLTIQPSSIAGLTVTGQIKGDLMAGGSMTNVNLGAGSDFISVTGDILTGTAVGGLQSFNKSGSTLTTQVFLAMPGISGGSISKMTLAHGSQSIATGAGGEAIGTGNAGNGGSITGLKILDGANGARMSTGMGGNSTSGQAGAGGSVLGVILTLRDDLVVETGAGGMTVSGKAGAGGGFSGNSVRFTETVMNLTVDTGDGGNAGAAGSGGAGGSIQKNSFVIEQSVGSFNSGALEFNAGDGGDVFGLLSEAGAGAGGAGGSVDGNTILATNNAATIKELRLFGGLGGDSTHGAGGVGGTVKANTTNLHATLGFVSSGANDGSLDLLAGQGGLGRTTGGAGGSISSNTLNFYSKVQLGSQADVMAGDGGSLESISGGIASGNGGAVSGLTLWFNGTVDGPGLLISGGVAGMGGNDIGAGGNGGDVQKLSITANAAFDLPLTVNGGDGGDASTFANSKGGNGGNVSGFILKAAGSFSGDVSVKAAAAGTGRGTGLGGAGGALSGINITLLADSDSNFSFASGTGGDGGVDHANGGNAGAIAPMTFNAKAIGGLQISGGGGGDGGKGPSNGGNASSITGLKVTAGNFTTDSLSLSIDPAGSGGVGGKGGVGGSITGFSIVTGSITALNTGVSILAADGGDGTPAGNGGNVSGFLKTGAVAKLAVMAGSGGAGTSGSNGLGANGGSVAGLTVTMESCAGNLSLRAGAGGGGGNAGGIGGNGGHISKVSVTNGLVNGSVVVSAGNGGSITTPQKTNGLGSGGSGGNITGLGLTLTGNIQNSLSITSGNGGDAKSFGHGGTGGAVSGVNLKVAAIANATSILAGDAGSSIYTKGVVGGAVSGVMFTNSGMISGNLLVSAGDGGDSGGYGAGGVGGALTGLTLNNQGGLLAYRLVAGEGGAALSVGEGGKGGAVSKVVLNSTGQISLESEISSGDGGAGGSSQGSGGQAGSVNAVTLKDSLPAGVAALLNVVSGSGGNGNGNGTFGGNTGTISNVILDGLGTKVQIGSLQTAGGTSGDGSLAKGGNGSLISGISGKVGQLAIVGAQGGYSETGAGGNGSSVAKIAITGVGDFVHSIAAGNGGNVGDALTRGVAPGSGGSISAVKVSGNIGDFSTPFDVTTPFVGMGGLIAGQGGSLLGVVDASKNGSVTNVLAQKIAAIVAGRPASNGITGANAVFAIASIGSSTTSPLVLGADVNLDGSFSYNNVGGPEYTPNADTAVDGLLVVRAAGLGKLQVTPLKVVTF